MNWLFEILLGLGWLILGGVVGWWLGRGTSKQVDETHDKLTWLIKGMEAEGMVAFRRDPTTGRIVGVVLNVEAALSTGTAHAEGHALLVTVDDPPADTQEI